MIVERTIIDTLKVAASPFTYYGAAPQPDGNEPAPLPVVIVNRLNSEWPNTFCGTDLALSNASIQVDYYARSSEGARSLADLGRAAIAGLLMRPGLQNERTDYDDFSRAWRVMQQWTVADYAPALV